MAKRKTKAEQKAEELEAAAQAEPQPQAPMTPADVTVKGFSGRAIFGWAQSKLQDLSLPQPRRPATEEKEYDFPEDPDSLTTTELGQLMLRFAGYAGYRMRQLGVLESELVALDREWKLKVGSYGTSIREQLGGRPSIETVEAYVLNAHPELLPLYKRVTELETVRANLKRQVETYEYAWQALSREQSRRSDQVRTGG